MNFYPMSGTVPAGSTHIVIYQSGEDAIFQITPPTGYHIDTVQWRGAEIDLSGNSGASFVAYDKTQPATFTLSGVLNGDQVVYSFIKLPETRIFNAVLADSAVKNRIRASGFLYKLSTLRTGTNLQQVRFTYKITDSNLSGVRSAISVSAQDTPVFYEGNDMSTPLALGFVNVRALHVGDTSYNAFQVNDGSGVVYNIANGPAVAECEINFTDNFGVYDVEVKRAGSVVATYTTTVSVSTPLYVIVQVREESSSSDYAEVRDIGIIGNFS